MAPLKGYLLVILRHQGCRMECDETLIIHGVYTGLMKLLCSLVLRQQILPYLLSDGSRVNRLGWCGCCFFTILVSQSVNPPHPFWENLAARLKTTSHSSHNVSSKVKPQVCKVQVESQVIYLLSRQVPSYQNSIWRHPYCSSWCRLEPLFQWRNILMLQSNDPWDNSVRPYRTRKLYWSLILKPCRGLNMSCFNTRQRVPELKKENVPHTLYLGHQCVSNFRKRTLELHTT